jgi:hypothetical protein
MSYFARGVGDGGRTTRYVRFPGLKRGKKAPAPGHSFPCPHGYSAEEALELVFCINDEVTNIII